MNHGSLFSGIGGFNIPAELLGWETVFNCEIDEFCQRVLKYYWPNTMLYEDIRKTDFKRYRGAIDVLSGGPPCQPASVAGKRKGEADDRWLWPETIRAVREIAPAYCVFENPTGILTLENGRLFKGILASLEDEGYQTECFIIPACSTGAPHKRDRIWIIAKSMCERYGISQGETSSNKKRKSNGYTSQYDESEITSDTKKSKQKFTGNTWSGRDRLTNICAKKISADTNGNQRSQRRMYETKPEEAKRHACTFNAWNNQCTAWDNFPTQSPICGGNDGIPRELDSITFSKWRNEAIKAYGNAVVPQIVYEIFKAI